MTEEKRIWEQDKAEYMRDIHTCWDSESMFKHFEKKFDGMVKFSDGNYITFEKPNIKTTFCYGYGMYLRSTEEEEKYASEMCRKAQKDTEYFIDENLSSLRELKKNALDDRYKMYIHTHYYGESDDCHLKGYGFCHQCEEPWSNLTGLRYLTNEERQMVAKGVEEQEKRFMKRLNAYLKRYGLSKIDSWTFLVD